MSLMFYLGVALIVIPSPILMFISSEAIAIIGSIKGYQPILLALSLAGGQTIGFTLLCHFADPICDRSKRFRRFRETSDLERYRQYAPRLIAWTSFVGIPPVNVSCIAAGAVKTPALSLMPLLFTGRFIRYGIIASIPEFFKEYINLDFLPSWVIDLF